MGIGIDEAGRGPVMGPLVVCALYAPRPSYLKKAGAKDSKLLAPDVREELDREFSRLPRSLVIIPASCIDEARATMTMNDLEVYAFASALASLTRGSPIYHPRLPAGCIVEVEGAAPPCRVWMDAADVDEARFTDRVLAESEMLGLPGECKLTGKHKADSTYPEVSASSIVAKVRRDLLIKRISSEIGEEIGSGYSHDQKTISFLESYIKKNNSFPPHVRRSWDTAKVLGNRSLEDFS